MKLCFKCGEEKPLPEFYKHPKMADGHLNKCKECTKSDIRKHRSENEHVRERDRMRWHRDPSRRIATRQRAAKWIKLYPKKRAAQNAVSNAVRDKRLMKPDSCESCCSKERRIHGHHDDYDKPLDVRWLCPVCHQKWHIENGEGKNGH